MPEKGPGKVASVMAIIFAILVGCFIILQIGLAVFSDINWIIKIVLGVLALFFVAVIIFLIIERKKEPPIKY